MTHPSLYICILMLILVAGCVSKNCVKNNDLCYSVFKSKGKWDDAENVCKSNGGHLTSITSQSEQTFLTNLISGSGSYWIGYNDKNREANFEWTDGSPSYTNWAKGEPSNSGNIEDCTEIYVSNGQWNDNSCDSKKSYICKTTRNCTASGCIEENNFYYKFVATPEEEWDSAEAACQALSGTLTSISDPSEQTFVFNKAKQAKVNGSFWIGYNDKAKEANFVWPDGSQFYTNWNVGEPNDSPGGEDCIAMNAASGIWNDLSCSHQANGFVCKASAVNIDCKSTRVNENDGNATIVFNRTGALPYNTTIFCSTKESTAKASSDYTHTNFSIMFEQNESVKKFNIPIVNDRHAEGNEVFNISCTTNDANVYFLPSCQVSNLNVEIKDDDINIDCKSARVNENDGNATIVFNRSGALPYNNTFFCSTEDSTAKTSSDYTHKTFSITFEQNESMKEFNIPILDDRHVERNEVFNINCTNNDANVYFLPSCQVTNLTVEIKDDDIDIDCKGVVLKEHHGNATITFNRTGALSYETKIYCSTRNSTAIDPTDFNNKMATISFKPNESMEKFTIPIVDDRYLEGDEVFNINCTTNDTNVDFLPSCQTENLKVEIKDEDIDISCKGATVKEKDGTATIFFNRTGALSYNTTIICTTIDGTAKKSQDYTDKTAHIMFGPGESHKNMTVLIVNDRDAESNEVLNINCTTSDSHVDFLASCQTNNLKVEIKDDDIDIGCQGATVKETDGNATIVFTRNGAPSFGTTIQCMTVDKTVDEPIDHNHNITEVKFEPNMSVKKMNVELVNDRHVEGDEVLNINCTTNDPYVDFLTSCQTENFKINVKDEDIDIDCKSARVNENDRNATVVLKRIGLQTYNTTIFCMTRDDQAKQPDDYVYKKSSITFGPGESEKNFTVQIINDNNVEDDEEFKINCTTNHMNIDFLPSCMTENFKIEIINDDIKLECVNATLDITERSKEVSVLVKRRGVSSFDTPFWVQTEDGTAFAKADYNPMKRKNFTFPSGQEYFTFPVGIVDDDHNEEKENFIVNIGVDYISEYPTVVAKKNCSVVLINDDDIDSRSSTDQLTNQQAEDLLEKRNTIIILLAIGIALIAITFIVLAVLICLVVH